MDKTIYLDHAAATPMDPAVLKAIEPYFSAQFYNPSALYLSAKTVGKAVAGARASMAHWLGARPSEIIYTAGGTEANNLAIRGVMEQFPDTNLVVSAVEHESVLVPAQAYVCQEAPVDNRGAVDLKKLEKCINDRTVLVSVMYANNEIGTIEPLTEVAHMLEKVRAERKKQDNTLPLYFHTDACQAANYLHLQTSRLGVDMMTLNAGKIYGPKQVGALYVRTGVQLKPQILGGGQELGRRSGTENVAGAIGFATAMDLAQQSREDEVARLQKLQHMAQKHIAEKIPVAIINGGKHRLPNNIHLTIPGQDNERLIMALDEAGIQAAAGSACSASSDEPSHVLRAIGLSDAEAQASLRFTMGRSTTEEAITTTVETLAKLVA